MNSKFFIKTTQFVKKTPIVSDLTYYHLYYEEMIEWFSQVLCWKHAGMVDSSTVANAYIWLTGHFSEVVGYASCTTSHLATI